MPDANKSSLAIIEQLQAENWRLISRVRELEQENFALATHQCQHPTGDEYGNPRCELQKDKERLDWLEQLKHPRLSWDMYGYKPGERVNIGVGYYSQFRSSSDHLSLRQLIDSKRQEVK